MAAAAILKFRVNGHNSATIERICTKFDVEMQNGDPEARLTSKFTSDKSKMAAAAILKFCFSGRNSAIFAHICTKFCTVTPNQVPETQIPSDLTYDKIQDGGGRHFEIFALSAITWPLLHVFAPNLT